MPYRNDPTAPKFDGNPTSLARFLDDVNWIAKNCQLSSSEIIHWTNYYAPNDANLLWKMQESANSNDWDKFQAELYALYPGSTNNRIYTINKLEALTREHSMLTFHTPHTLGKYYREFLKIGMILKKDDRQTDRELSAHFLHGFDCAFRSKVIDQLRRLNPRRHPDIVIYPINDILEAALYILDCEVHDREEFQLKTFRNFNNEMVHNPDPHLIADNVQQNPIQDLQIVLRRNSNCTFCSSPNHFHRNCPSASRYIDAGYITRDANGHIILPDGMRIQSYMAPGRNIMEKLQHITKKISSRSFQPPTCQTSSTLK
jgi:hypothetical protein